MISYDIPIKIPFGKYFFFHRLFLKELVYCGFTRLTRSPILNRIVEIVPISCCCMTDIELSQENSSDIPIPFDPTRLPSMFTLSLIFFFSSMTTLLRLLGLSFLERHVVYHSSFQESITELCAISDRTDFG